MNRIFERGFSLLEIMTVVSILAIVAAIGLQISRNVIIAAKQSEAKLNVATISQLAQTYTGNHESVFSSMLVGNDRSTSTSCNYTNAIGFKISDCQRLNFTYFASGTPSTNVAYAFEGFDFESSKTVLFHTSNCGNVWMGQSGRLTDLLDKNTCYKTYDLWRLHFGQTTGAGDFNGNGAADAADFIIVRGVIQRVVGY